MKVAVSGDSVLQGSTASTPGTDDAVSLFCTTVAARFGVTVTKSNRAQGGRTAAWERIEQWSTLLADKADLYVLGITGKNDITWEAGGSSNSRLTGFRTADSLAEIESQIRELRATRPTVDIMIVSGNPYGSAYTSSNLYQRAYSAGLAALAAAYDCAYADGWGLTPRAPGFPDAAHADYLSDGVHPNSAGHRIIADAMLAHCPVALDPAAVRSAALLAADPPAASLYPVRRSRRGIVTVTTASTTAQTDRLINPSFTGTWTAGGTGPWTSSTVGATAEFIAKATDLFAKFTAGAGQGVVDVYVDGIAAAAAVNLTDAGYVGGKWLAIATGLTPGVHNMTIVVVSGTVTIEAIAYTSAACEWVNLRDARVTSTNLGVASDLNQFWGIQSNFSTSTTTLTFDFVGTGLTIQVNRGSQGSGNYLAPNGFVLDGVVQPQYVVPTAFSGYGCLDLIKGLEYGKHTVALTFQAGGLAVGGFSIIDEHPETHPNSCEGMAKVGETVRFPYPWTTDTPTVTVTSSTGNAAGASTVTPTSFLVTGTAGEVVRWKAVSAQRGVY